MANSNDETAQRRKKSARFADIAAEAGVSEATVDRVLNERGSVSPSSRERVVTAALKLKVKRVLPDVRHGIVHFDVVLPINHSPMFQRLNLAMTRAVQMLDRQIVVHRTSLDHRNDEAFARAILNPPYPRSGLIVIGSTAPLTTSALRAVIASGEPIAAMVSEVPDVQHVRYVGIDNDVAGRTAGHAIGRLTRGEGNVLVLTGHCDFRAHEQRTAGCIEALRALHPAQPCVVAATETNDDPDRCYRVVCAALQDGPISAIYNSGDGSLGVHKALRRFAQTGKLVWIGHEMQDQHAEYLLDGSMDFVIDQNPDAQAISALQYLLFKCGQIDQPPVERPTALSLFVPPNARQEPYLT